MNNAFNYESKIIDDYIAPGIKPNMYMLYSNGDIFNITTGYKLSLHPNAKGYPCMNMQMANGHSNSYLVHRILMKAFNPIDNPNDYDIDHKNCNPGCYRLTNLEWVTRKENIRRAIVNGLFPIGEDAGAAIISNDDAIFICEELTKGTPMNDIEQQLRKRLGHDRGNLRSIINSVLYREKWKSISKDYQFHDYGGKKRSTTNQ